MPKAKKALCDNFTDFSHKLSTSRYAIVFSGAGISTPSGIADFRTPRSGLWERFDPMLYSSLTAFRTNPNKFYEWLRPLLTSGANALPNPAHHVIAQLEKGGFLHGVITQNIDGLHKKAGTEIIAEIHGSMNEFLCMNCRKRIDAGSILVLLAGKKPIPTCPVCGSVLKPDIVLYEEMLPEKEWEKAVTMTRRSDLFIVSGSSLEVYPAASLPQMAKKNGACLVINTLLPTALDDMADMLFRCDVVNFWETTKRMLYG
jgi:NAD-dependent deacetylase